MALGPFTAKDHAEITTLGTEFALSEVLGALGGWWIDKKLGTLPWCLIGGVFVGFIVGLYRIVQVARKQSKQGKENGRR